MKSSTEKKSGKLVSSRVSKSKVSFNPDDPMARMIMGFFDDELKREFTKFLAEKTLPSKVVNIEERKRGEYKKEGREPISFKEMTAYKNPLFSLMGSFSPAQYNPETIDVDTFSLMRRDPQIGLGLSVIKMPVAALPWTIECPDLQIKKCVTWMLKKIWKPLIRTTLMAVDYGFSANEKVWEMDKVKISEADSEGKETVHYSGNLVYFKKIKAMHPSSVKMKFDDKENLEEIHQEGDISTANDIILPLRKCYLFTHNDEYGNPFGVSRLKNAYKIWYWKELLYQFMMQYFERRGTPPMIGTAPMGRSQDSAGSEIENMDLMLRMATSLISSSVAIIPYQPDKESGKNMWSIEPLKDDARGPMFVEAMEHMDIMCMRAILVPESVAGSGGGSYAQSTVHADIFLMTEKDLITDIQDAIDRQIIAPFVEANFPPDKRKQANVRLDPLDWNRKTTLKELFTEMIRNIDTMVQMGVPPKTIPSFEKMAEILEVPVTSWEDATGISQEEMMEMTMAKNQPPAGEEGGKGSTATEKKPDKAGAKIAGRKKTRPTDVPQATERRRVNPGGRRADRMRDGKNE